MKISPVFRLVLIVAFLVVPLAVASAQIVLSQNLAASVFPVGASAGTRVFYSLPLYGGPEAGLTGVLWDNARVEAGINNQLTPAFDDLGVELFVEPIAVMDLRVRFARRWVYDTLGFGFIPLPEGGVSAPPAYDGDTFSRNGTVLEITPRVKAAAGPFVFLNALMFRQVRMDLREGESGWFYEPVSDEPVRSDDWIIQNGTILLYTIPTATDDQVLAGLDNTLLWVTGDELRRWRISGMFVWATQRVVPGAEFSLAVLVGGYPRHRAYRLESGEVYAALQTGLTWRW